MMTFSRKTNILAVLSVGLLIFVLIRQYSRSQAIAKNNVVYIGAVDYWDFETESKVLDSQSAVKRKNSSTSVTRQKVTFRQALEKVAGPDKVVILAMIDNGYVDMALNFYETSIQPYNLTNLLFVSVVSEACHELRTRNLPCFTFLNDTNTADSNYMSKVFLGKMNTRTNFIYQALQWGYSILQVDIDVIFLQNPFKYFTCSDCAIESMQDGIKNYINCGFVLLKSRSSTIGVYKKMVERAKVKPMSEDQRNLNEFVHKDKVKYRVLDAKKFVCGLDYYESPKRYFLDTAKPCPECVVIHNNWIVSRQAKEYRFKEMGQWMIDTDGYYTSPTAKYLTYDNPRKENFHDTEKNALITALAISHILNRTLILPKFHCDQVMCALNNFVLIRDFDAHFPYREHMFLKHPKVPSYVKTNLSTFTITDKAGTKATTGASFTTGDSSGVTQEELIKWFGESKVSVLKFTNMYIKFKGFTDPVAQEKFDESVKASFKKAGYRQF